MGIEGWSWDEVLPFFKQVGVVLLGSQKRGEAEIKTQSETFHPSDGMKGDPAVHGTTGELHTWVFSAPTLVVLC